MYRALRESKKGRDLVYTGKEVGGRVQERPCKPVNEGRIALICLISDTLTRQSSKEQGPSSVGSLHYLCCTEQYWPIYTNIRNLPQGWCYCSHIPMRKSSLRMVTLLAQCHHLLSGKWTGLDRTQLQLQASYLLSRGPPKEKLCFQKAKKSTLTSSQSGRSPKHILNFSVPDSLLLLSVPPGKTFPSFYLSKSYCSEVTSFISFKLCLYFWCHHLPCVRIICVYLSTVS